MTKKLPRKVSDIMTRDVYSIDEDDTLTNLLETMNSMRFRHTPVTDDGNHLVGLLSERDLLRVSASSLLPSGQQDSFLKNQFHVRDIMQRDVQSVRPEARIADAGRLMLRERIGSLPVVDDSNELVGIVTESDLVELALELLPLD